MTAEGKRPVLVSTIVPAMNEEGNIAEFCRLYSEMLAGAPFEGELVIVDDGSTDGTLQKIEGAACTYDFVRYAVHPHNRGLTEALQTGFAAAKGEIFVFYPADLQFRPVDIPSLVAPILDGADLCAGWKQGKYGKQLVSGIYNWVARKIFNLKVHDLNSCKAFRREVVENIFLRRDWHRYLVVLAADEGYRVEEVKVPLYERNWGRSKFTTFWRIPVGVLDMLAVKFQLTFLRKPLLFFGLLGSMLFALGVLVGLWALYLRYMVGEGQRPLLYLVMLLVGLGMALFMMGFMTEGQTAIKEELADLRKKMRNVVGEKTKRPDQ
ncbi:MAG: glycosyltransferase family 2 protein [candidate division Zixibacteria bacterium]|nr:glycosyltransferase family 2 protein [candidate division Zixibacteria bacterium]